MWVRVLGRLLPRSANLNVFANISLSPPMTVFIHNESRKRFLYRHPLGEAVVSYKKDNSTLVLYETVVPKELRGKGLGTILAKEVFDFCLRNDQKIVLTCSFLQDFYKRNREEYEGIVVEEEEEEG